MPCHCCWPLAISVSTSTLLSFPAHWIISLIITTSIGYALRQSGFCWCIFATFVETIIVLSFLCTWSSWREECCFSFWWRQVDVIVLASNSPAHLLWSRYVIFINTLSDMRAFKSYFHQITSRIGHASLITWICIRHFVPVTSCVSAAWLSRFDSAFSYLGVIGVVSILVRALMENECSTCFTPQIISRIISFRIAWWWK